METNKKSFSPHFLKLLGVHQATDNFPPVHYYQLHLNTQQEMEYAMQYPLPAKPNIADDSSLFEEIDFGGSISQLKRNMGKPLFSVNNQFASESHQVLFYESSMLKTAVKRQFHFLNNQLFFVAYDFVRQGVKSDRNMQNMSQYFREQRPEFIHLNTSIDDLGNREVLHLRSQQDFSFYYLMEYTSFCCTIRPFARKDAAIRPSAHPGSR